MGLPWNFLGTSCRTHIEGSHVTCDRFKNCFYLVLSLIFELQAFEWFDKVGEWERHFKTWERYLVIYLGSAVMWILGKSLKKKYQLKEDVRESLYDDVNFWMKSLRAKGTPFMGGEQPGNNFIR